MRRTIVLSSAVVAALVLALAGFAGASPGADRNGVVSGIVPEVYKGLVEIKENGWIVFNMQQEYPLKNAEVYTKQGERAPSGACVYSGELVLPADSEATAIEERGTAINPSTCQMRMERGTPPADAIADELDGAPSSQQTTESDEQESSPQSATNGSGGEVSVAATKRRSAGLHRTWWEDPGHIEVNFVRNNTDWLGTGAVSSLPSTGDTSTAGSKAAGGSGSRTTGTIPTLPTRAPAVPTFISRTHTFAALSTVSTSRPHTPTTSATGSTDGITAIW